MIHCRSVNSRRALHFPAASIKDNEAHNHRCSCEVLGPGFEPDDSIAERSRAVLGFAGGVQRRDDSTAIVINRALVRRSRQLQTQVRDRLLAVTPIVHEF
jgi:hypothetical protein